MANESENGTETLKGIISSNVTLPAWTIPKLNANLKQTDNTNNLIDKTSESAKNYSNSLRSLNATGYVALDDDLTDTGFTDVQTFILAGVATVIPLLVIVIIVLGIRFLWTKYRAKKEDGYKGVLQKEESSEPLEKIQSYSLPQELKTSESQFTVTPNDQRSALSTQLPTPKSNGSVITMTLKNNHLIVETEETTNPPEGMKIESKGTTTKFVTSKAPDFNLESHNNVLTDFNKHPPGQLVIKQDEILSLTNHGALIHCAPEETEDEIERENNNTGLSQSDLSVSSSESQNPSYRYGNQTGYDSGGYGYPEYCGYSMFSNKKTNLHETGPKIYKIYQKGFSDMEQGNSHPSNRQAGNQSQLKDILMSDIQAREKREYEIKHEEENVVRNGASGYSTETTVTPKNDFNYTDSIVNLEIKDPFSENETFKPDNDKCLTKNGMNGKENES